MSSTRPPRFERSGGLPDLQAAFRHLVEARLGGRSLDDNHASEGAAGRFPDFGCFRDILLIEMKHLETDQQDRINEVFAKIPEEELPVFYGQRDGRLITEAASNGAEIVAEITSKLGRTLETVLRSANKQFDSYRSRHPRKNSVNVCVVLNAGLQEFTPELVGHAIHGKLKPDSQGRLRYPHIDGVFYISEKHFQILPDGRPALGIMLYEGMGMIEAPWKGDFLDRLAVAWSELRTGAAPVFTDKLDGFETVRDIPEELKRYEQWELEYERDPYFAHFTFEAFRVMFNRTMSVLSQKFIIGPWEKPTDAEVMDAFRMFQHITTETNRRGTDMRTMHRRFLTPEERRIVDYGMPAELVAMMDRPGFAPPNPAATSG